MSTLDLLERLSDGFGPSGHEEEIRDLIRAEVEGLVDEVRTDRLGNLICTRRGRRDETLLLDAHMDEVGFLISYVDVQGFGRLSPLGGWDARVLPGHLLTIRGRDGQRVRGVIGTLPPHVTGDTDRSKAFKLPDLFVDIGATSRDEALAMGVEVGSPVVPGYRFERLDDLVLGKALDDRAGCAAVISILRALDGTELDLTLVASFTVAEEVGVRGATSVAGQIEPAVAIALEGTTGVDVPGVSGAKKLCSMGAGPAITIADARIIASRRVNDLLREVAAAGNIDIQMKLPGGGGTNAGAYQSSGLGALTGVISVPVRYIHAPMSMLRPSDLDGAIALGAAFAQRAGELV